MIQELLSAVVEDRRKLPFPSPFHSSSSSNPQPSPSSDQKLRCPRCDSSNTKFCYYNNYNLTQPRHFCKTCRRYWTKGGALRNVPIGGGCRKAKPSPVVPKPSLKPNKPIPSFAGFGLEPDLFSPSPILWAGPNPHPNASQLLALLRANSVIKEERMVGEAEVGLGPNLDPFLFGPPYAQIQENGIQEVYQRSVATSNGWSTGGGFSMLASSVGGGGGSLNADGVGPAVGGEFGFWNPAFSSWAEN